MATMSKSVIAAEMERNGTVFLVNTTTQKTPLVAMVHMLATVGCASAIEAGDHKVTKPKKDHHVKEPSYFREPCNTCIHRRLDLHDPKCPCRECVHYAN